MIYDYAIGIDASSLNSHSLVGFKFIYLSFDIFITFWVKNTSTSIALWDPYDVNFEILNGYKQCVSVVNFFLTATVDNISLYFFSSFSGCIVD